MHFSWGKSLTSQVSQRPQHASVVIRSALQPGFLARKVNSRTAQPMKVRRSMAEVSVPPWPASRRRSRAPRVTQGSFMLRQKGEEDWESQDGGTVHGPRSPSAVMPHLPLGHNVPPLHSAQEKIEDKGSPAARREKSYCSSLNAMATEISILQAYHAANAFLSVRLP